MAECTGSGETLVDESRWSEKRNVVEDRHRLGARQFGAACVHHIEEPRSANCHRRLIDFEVVQNTDGKAVHHSAHEEKAMHLVETIILRRRAAHPFGFRCIVHGRFELHRDFRHDRSAN